MKGTSGDFVVLRTEPSNNGKLFLNEPIRIDFSNSINLDTANLNTVSFAVFDLNGKPLTEQPTGQFRVTTSPGDAAPGRRLEFVPRFPTNDTYDNGGFRPGRRYLVQLVGGDRRLGNVLKDNSGKSLGQAVSFEFRTADGTTPSQLFLDTRSGGPRRTLFEVTPSDATGVALNQGGQAFVEIRLGFDQPLNPNSNNVPVKLDTDPTRRAGINKGRIFLEYDDPDPRLGKSTWLPADVDLEINSLDRSLIVMRPVGVLPNNATVRVIVENTVEDMSGESNVADAAYDRIFATFRTRAKYEPQFDAVVETFLDSRNIDLNAPFLEPFADLTGGQAKASFSFEGQRTVLQYVPDTTEVVLNTDFTQIKPSNGPPLNVSGGVFTFDQVRIPKGTTVRGIGSRPMVWLVNGDFVVEGELSVTGGPGARVDTLNGANFPTPGGTGVCGGGSGGRGSPNTTGESARGESGFGPGQVPGGGGEGGRVDRVAACGRGSAGGGGTFATQGDPYFKIKTMGTCFLQQQGIGGSGCTGGCGNSSRTLAGGAPGPSPFTDARNDNDFWGVGVDLSRQLRISGELLAPIGGQGGGGGGDRYRAGDTGANFANGEKGGGGGGGGGILIIKCLGKIEVTESGIIRADGGNGGGGEAAGGNQEGGGGAGGSGGIVVLMAGQKIILHKHGETYANNDYDFAVSADGGVGTQGSFGGREWNTKYPPLNRNDYDGNPSGAWGGLGLIQLMAPPGDGIADETNTVLDDNIEVQSNGTPLKGAEKMRYLAWRGFRNGDKWFDDDGNEITIGDAEGDLRPAPTLLPAPFGHLSRLRSRWLDTGATVRRPLQAPDGAPRGVVENKTVTPPLLAGPDWLFDGTNTDPSGTYQGFVDYDATATGVAPRFPLVTLQGSTVVLSTRADQNVDGTPAYLIEIASPALGSIVNRYAHYRAELVNASLTVVGSYRILQHSDSRLFVAASAPLPTDSELRLQVRAQFFDISVNGTAGLGPTYDGPTGQKIPAANVRIGFAFHRDATMIDTDGDGIDENRFPMAVGEFTYDLNSVAAREALRTGRYRYVQWDILFNTRFSPTDDNNTNPNRGLTTLNPLPAIDNLTIPNRF